MSEARLTTRCLRFWIDEPSERCAELWEAADEMARAYNAMLETFEEGGIRREVVEDAERAKAEWEAWKAAGEPVGAKPTRPAKFARQTKWTYRLRATMNEAAPRLHSHVRDAMRQAEFARDVETYLDRRVWKRMPASIRRKGLGKWRGMATGLSPSGGWRVTEDADGVWATLPLWGLGHPDWRKRNATLWRLSPYDRRNGTWTRDILRAALAEGQVRGCKVVPPRPDAPKGKRQFSLMITVGTPAAQPATERWQAERAAGVDVGLNSFAVYSCPDAKTFRFFSSKDLQRSMDRRRSDTNGVLRNRHQVIGKAIGRRQDHFCRLVAKRIADRCVRDHVTELRVEDLSGIRDAAGNDANRRFALGSKFPYYKLQTYLEQACEKHGVRVAKIDPVGTSQTCSFCGHRDPASRVGKRFICVECGYRADADLNAANNVARGRNKVTRRACAAVDTTPPAGSIPFLAASGHTDEALEDAAY